MTNKSLTHNTLWNLAGQSFTLLIAFFTIPSIIHGMGTERFGIFTLNVAIIYYFTFFDFGLGFALTHLLSQKLEQKSPADKFIPLIWSTLITLFVISLIIMLFILCCARPAVKDWLSIPSYLQKETLISLYLFVFVIPLILINSGLRGIINAHHRFDLVNAVEIPITALRFLLPLITLFYTNNLTFIILGLVIAQIFAFLFYFLGANQLTHFFKSPAYIDRSSIKTLFQYGGWLTITQFNAAIMIYTDRLLLGVLTSMKSVAYYTTPYDIITKLWIIPASVAGPLFAKVSSKYKMYFEEIRDSYIRGLKYVFILIFPIVLIILSFAKEGLHLWLGIEFAENSSLILQWLSLGIFVSSLAQISLNLITGAGRPDLSAKLHLIELPFYLGALWLLITNLGAMGAAIAWVVRASIDAMILFIISARLTNIRLRNILSGIPALLMVFFLCAISVSLTTIKTKIIFLALSLTIFAIGSWRIILSKEERIWFKNRIVSLKPQASDGQ